MENKKFGIKLSIIDKGDYQDYKEICDAIIKLGYKATVVDNGNTVFEKNK